MHVYDERIVRRPALDSENLFHCVVRARIRAQTVHRFGGKSDGPARK